MSTPHIPLAKSPENSERTNELTNETERTNTRYTQFCPSHGRKDRFAQKYFFTSLNESFVFFSSSQYVVKDSENELQTLCVTQNKNLLTPVKLILVLNKFTFDLETIRNLLQGYPVYTAEIYTLWIQKLSNPEVWVSLVANSCLVVTALWLGTGPRNYN